MNKKDTYLMMRVISSLCCIFQGNFTGKTAAEIFDRIHTERKIFYELVADYHAFGCTSMQR